MNTQQYPTQAGPPIATRPRKFEPTKVPEIVAIAAIPGEMAPSEFGASEVKFKLVDGRPWFLPQSVADEIYRAGIVPRQQFEVTKTGRSKADLRIVPLPAHLGGGAALTAPHAPATTTPRTQGDSNLPRWDENLDAWGPGGREAPSRPFAPRPPAMPLAEKLLAAYKLSIDTLIKARDYAGPNGLELAITCQSVHDLAATILSGAGQKL